MYYVTTITKYVAMALADIALGPTAAASLGNVQGRTQAKGGWAHGPVPSTYDLGVGPCVKGPERWQDAI